MPISRSYSNAFEVVDYTEELMKIPNQWGLFERLGIFNNEGITTHTVTFEEIDQTFNIITDRVRGERNNVSKNDGRKIHAFSVPHFPLDDYIAPEDIQGKRAYGSGDEAETLAAARLRKMERIRLSHASTLEVARAKLIDSGDVYAPNGTVVTNFYTAFSITRKSVAFDLGTGTTDLIAKCEEVIAHIQDNLFTGEITERVVGICSPAFFAALISHASVKEAYKYYASQPEPLRARLGARGQGLDGRFRSFEFGGILFIEYRGTYAGYGSLMTADEARFIPMGTMDTFYTYYSPAAKFDLVNTIGQQAYMFEYRDPKGAKIEIETESNFMNAIRRPAVVVRGVKGASI